MENKEEKSENLDKQIAPPPTDDQSVVIDSDQATANTEPVADTSVPQSAPQPDTNPPVGISSSEGPDSPALDVPASDTKSVQPDMLSTEKAPEVITSTPEQAQTEKINPVVQLEPSILANPASPTEPQATQNEGPQVVIKEVIREVPVEKIVEKEVIKEIPVEKIVYKEVPVERIVEREVRVFDASKFNDELKKHAISILPKALAGKRAKKDAKIKRVLEYIQKEKTATSWQLQTYLRLSPMTIFRYTNSLVNSGFIKYEGKRRSRVYIAK